MEIIIKKLCNTKCNDGCEYCHKHLDIKKQLKIFFDKDDYKKYDGENLQEQAVQAAVNNESLLAVFPTGGGKSIAFQVPALMAGENERGLTVVISPLQSLMKDQVDKLREHGIAEAVTINGSLNPIEKAEAIRNVENGNAYLLYPNKKYDLLLKVSEDGFTTFKDDKPIIYYNQNQMYQRMNNTIVHEIGHIVLGHLQASELAEAEVNFFAKYLLAPPVLIHKLQLHSAEEIANIFEISHQAAQIAWDYYNKWLLNSGRFYKPYEIKLIDLFQNNIGEHLQSNTQYPI